MAIQHIAHREEEPRRLAADAVIYLRVETDRVPDSNSVDLQRIACRDVSQRLGPVAVDMREEYAESEGHKQ